MTPAQEDDLKEISSRPVTGELVRLMITSLTNGRKELASDICDLAEREIVPDHKWIEPDYELFERLCNVVTEPERATWGRAIWQAYDQEDSAMVTAIFGLLRRRVAN